MNEVIIDFDKVNIVIADLKRRGAKVVVKATVNKDNTIIYNIVAAWEHTTWTIETWNIK